MKVFLSYHEKDRLAARGLKRGLESAGLHVVDPLREVAPGENVFARVGQGLEDAQAIVVVVSPDAMRSPWSRRELDYALTQSRFEGRVIPVVARRSRDLPWILERMPMLDLKSGAVRVGRKAGELIRRAPSRRRRKLGA